MVLPDADYICMDESIDAFQGVLRRRSKHKNKTYSAIRPTTAPI